MNKKNEKEVTRGIGVDIARPAPGEETVKVGKYKRPRVITDQLLKYRYPNNGEPTLFDNLESDTITDIKNAGVKVTEIVEGIELTPGEWKLVDSLCKLLHDKSQNSKPTEESYYSGNAEYKLTKYGGENTPAPKLAFTLYELTKEYKGGDLISGNDVKNVRKILKELDSKRFLLRYVETTRKKDGGRVERKIEEYSRIIHIIKVAEYDKDDNPVDRGVNDTEVVLSPIFRRQIENLFTLYPNDIMKRTIIAYGSPKISIITFKLREYLIRELGNRRYTPEITLDKLYYQIAEKWMREGRKKRVKDDTEKALETVKAIGLLLSWEIVTGANGQPKVVFTLNKNWE